MNKCIYLGIILFLIAGHTAAQNTIEIPLGTSPVYDGIIGQSEWTDADSILLFSLSGIVKVLYKHDCTNLNVAFLGPLESANANFPEVLIDANNDKSTNWQADDWWFHVSATDCYFQGTYGDYTNCSLVQPDWIGIPNISSGNPMTDSIEIQIPLSTAGITVTDTIGITVLVTNTFSSWTTWPNTASQTSPTNWGTATFEGCATGTGNEPEFTFQIFPNPANNKLFLNSSFVLNQKVEIYNSLGALLHNSEIHDVSEVIDISEFPAGLYVVKLISDKGTLSKRVLKVM